MLVRHDLSQLVQIDELELVPLGQDRQYLSVLCSRIGVIANLDAFDRTVLAYGIKRADDRTRLNQAAGDLNCRRIAHVIGTCLKGQPQYANLDAIERVTGSQRDLVYDPVKLLLVDLDHPLEKREVIARILGDADHGLGVLRETRPAPTGAGAQKVVADA